MPAQQFGCMIRDGLYIRPADRMPAINGRPECLGVIIIQNNRLAVQQAISRSCRHDVRDGSGDSLVEGGPNITREWHTEPRCAWLWRGSRRGGRASAGFGRACGSVVRGRGNGHEPLEIIMRADTGEIVTSTERGI